MPSPRSHAQPPRARARLGRAFAAALGLAFVLLTATRAPAAGDESLKPRKYVLAVGITQFTDPLWRNLRFAGKDAQDVYRALNSGDDGFDGGQTLGEGGSVSRAELTQAMARLAAVNRNEDDTVFVYLSTHGSVAYRPDGSIGRFIITSDTDSQRVNQTALDYDDLVASFRALRSRKKVLILAFCHSGVGKSVLTPDMKRALARLKAPYFEEPIQESSEGSIILTASGWREPALEDESLENDVYTHFLIKGFDQDLNGDGAVSVTEAHSYAAEQTFRFTRGQQRPSAIVEILGSDPILVKGRKGKRGSAMLYSFINRFSDLVVSVNGESKGSLKKGIDVPEGKVRVVIQDPAKGTVLADRFIRFEAGRDYAVDNILIPTLPHSFVLGPRVAQATGRAERKAYAPEALTGVYGRYAREETVGSWDAAVDVAYFPPRNETVTTAAGDSFGQERGMGQLGLLTGDRHVIGFLSRADRRFFTEATWLVGARALWLRRAVEAPAFKRHREDRVSPGLVGILGLQYTVPYYLLKTGIESEWAAHDRVSDETKAVSGFAQFGAFLGTYW